LNEWWRRQHQSRSFTYLLGIDKGHSILEIEIALAVEIETHLILLDDASINGVQDRSLTDLAGAEVSEKQVQV
jgi:hypothetical protein